MKDENPQLFKQTTHIFARQSSIKRSFYSRHSSTDSIGSIAVSHCYDIDASSGLIKPLQSSHILRSNITLHV